MSKRPHVVFFFMTGCPHCEATWPAWEKAKKTLKKGGVKVSETESKEVSPADGVSAFPTFVVKVDDKEVKRVEGAQTDADKLAKELDVKSGGGRSRRHRTRRARRQFTQRTLRNYKAL